MKELEVGMYIRYVPTLGSYTQKISKITKTKNCLLDMAYYLDNEKEPVFSSHFDYILKSSFNPIDLIQENDYVNGYKVIEIIKDFKVIVDKSERNTNDGNYYLKSFTNNQIKDIVTKEQFESMKYVIKEK